MSASFFRVFQYFARVLCAISVKYTDKTVFLEAMNGGERGLNLLADYRIIYKAFAHVYLCTQCLYAGRSLISLSPLCPLGLVQCNR